jgi:hypothetical protein
MVAAPTPNTPNQLRSGVLVFFRLIVHMSRPRLVKFTGCLPYSYFVVYLTVKKHTLSCGDGHQSTCLFEFILIITLFIALEL